MFWNNWFKKKIIQPTTLIGGVISDFENIDIIKFENVYSSDYSNISFICIEKRLESYIDLLKFIIYHLENNKLIAQYNIPNQVQQIYLYNFFLDVDGNYINPKETFERFKNEVIKLLTLYEEIENRQEKTDTESKNLVSITHVVNNLIQLSGVLKL